MPSPLPAYLSAVHHDGSARCVRPAKPGRLKLGDEVTIRLRTAPASPIQRILLRICPDGEQLFTEMIPGDDLPPCRWWQARLKLVMPITNYRFLILAEDGVWWLNGAGLQRGTPTDAHDFRILAGYRAPEWSHSSVFYQIFPDRFANGDPSNDVKDGEYTYSGHPSRRRTWGEAPSIGGGAPMVEFFGGDLPGVEQKLGYLQDLGVNAIYLNPVFTSFSNHRYDVVDYDNVDPHLGGNPALASLREATAARRMRLILDITPNHCGVMHPWFQEALQDPNAPTAEYFTFLRHPDDYATWLGVRGLPKLNYRSQKLREVMYAGPQAIFRRWMRPPYAIDGWRLDVANMLARQGADQLGLEVGHGIRRAVREENPEAYILGENFFDSTPQLMGDSWDAVMNYSGFAKPLWYWLAGFHINQWGQPRRVESDAPYSTEALLQTWQDFRASIPWEIARQQFNLLGSHDTERILTRVKGSLPLAKLAAAVLFTYPGVPCVYYGDEIGLGISKNDSSRDCMPWDEERWNLDIRAAYQTLIQMRRTSPALINGGFQVLAVEEDFLAYQRDSDEEILIVTANRGPSSRPAGALDISPGGLPDGLELTEIFSGRKAVVSAGSLYLESQPPGAEIWRGKF